MNARWDTPPARPEWFRRYVSLGWARTVFEAQSEPVAWGARILRELISIEPGLPEVDAILALAADPALWPSGHDRLGDARRRSLADQSAQAVETPRTMLLMNAELVAKIAHNATGPRDPLDEDTGMVDRVISRPHRRVPRGCGPRGPSRSRHSRLDD